MLHLLSWPSPTIPLKVTAVKDFWGYLSYDYSDKYFKVN